MFWSGLLPSTASPCWLAWAVKQAAEQRNRVLAGKSKNYVTASRLLQRLRFLLNLQGAGHFSPLFLLCYFCSFCGAIVAAGTN